MSRIAPRASSAFGRVSVPDCGGRPPLRSGRITATYRPRRSRRGRRCHSAYHWSRLPNIRLDPRGPHPRYRGTATLYRVDPPHAGRTRANILAGVGPHGNRATSVSSISQPKPRPGGNPQPSACIAAVATTASSSYRIEGFGPVRSPHRRISHPFRVLRPRTELTGAFHRPSNSAKWPRTVRDSARDSRPRAVTCVSNAP